ncbi:MAG TPA: beta-ketoacyl synthase N-terminal-like domain-containing protein, partial [Trinickia sp.]|nr:beta-ketoacyl synthase N-terminal-like domain-containing protein [Trinickia sp.]
AEPIRRATLMQFAERFAPYGFNADAFYPCFGLAEATLFVSGSNAGAPLETLTVSADALSMNRAVEAEPAHTPVLELVGCGSIAQPGHRVVLADPVSREPVAHGAVGEVWVQGPSVAAGYWCNAEASAATFEATLADGTGPFMRTGDLGFLRGDELFVTGRIKDLILVRGRNHYPQDIEATISRSDAHLEHSVVVAFEISREDKAEVVALCEAAIEPGRESELFKVASEAVAREHGLPLFALGFVRPRLLPRTSSGKLQRNACRVAFKDGTLKLAAIATQAEAQPAAPASAPVSVPARRAGGTPDALRAWAIDAIAQIRHVDRASVDPDASFFELGLDSIELVRLAGDFETRLARPVEPSALFDYPTINKALGHLCSEGDAPPAIELQPSRPGTDEAAPHACVAVVGMSCRFPGAEDVAAFWSLLENGGDAISEVPRQRWDVDALYAPEPAQPGRMSTRWGGFIDDIDAFDAEFFNIAPREAQRADPQHRILLQLAWHALEDAGLAPGSLAGSRTGVFLGVSSSDYAHLQGGVEALDAYSATGNAHSIAANRISYYFDFRGPSLAVDTACSSSLVALHLACRSLLDGECDLALVGGVNLMIGPELHVVFSQARMMASDGRCKAFDDEANGYVRGEGAAFVVLRRREQARRDGDRPLALIRGTAVNQDGRSNGITAPNGLAQEAVMRAALDKAGVDPASVDYVEAHGTGTRLGDPIEYRALQRTYAAAQRERPLLIGSVKGNIGHLEAAAGIAGLIKVVLSLQHDAIAPQLHFRTLNRTIAENGKGVAVCASGQRWARGPRARLAGVSAFGFGGTNCHVIVEEAPREDARAAHAPPEAALPDPILTLSAASEASLQRICARYAEHVGSSDSDALANACYTTNVGRAHLAHRLALPAGDAAALATQLTRFAAGDRDGMHCDITHRQGRRIAFAFTGQGAQFHGMGRRLFESEPVFRQSIETCAALLEPHMSKPLLAVLYGEDGAALMAQTEFAQPAIVAFEYSLAQLWRAWGIEPAAVIGHSVGEYAAACVAGALSLEDSLALVAARGRLMESLPATGMMAALHADEPTVRALVATQGSRAEIAALNGPKLTVISGLATDVREVIALAREQNILGSALRGERGFHSAQLDPILDALERTAAGVRHDDPAVPVFSNLFGDPMTSGRQWSGRYWREHARQAVQYARCASNAAASGIDVFLEIGPDATLTSIGKRQSVAGDVRFVASLRGEGHDGRDLAQALAQLYASGCDPDWTALHARSRATRVALPP